MPGATIPDVSLYSKERNKNIDTFDLTFTYQGIDIERPDGEVRHLPWERITEWEIEQRRGGVLLTLRGSGSVTPLIIPKWRVDDLDEVLRDVTSGVPVPESVFEAEARAAAAATAAVAVAVAPVAVAPVVVEPEVEPEPEAIVEAVVEAELVIEPEPEPEPEVAVAPVVEPVAFSESYGETVAPVSAWSAPVVSEPEPEPEPEEIEAPAVEAEAEATAWSRPEPEPEAELVVEPVAELVIESEPVVEPEPVAVAVVVEEEQEETTTHIWGDDADQDGLDTVLWPNATEPRLKGPRPDLMHTQSEDRAWTVEDPSFASAIDADSGKIQVDDDVDSNLEWPSDEPLDSIPKLEWPSGGDRRKQTDEVEIDAPAAALASGRGTAWVIEEIEDLPPAVPTAMIPLAEAIVEPTPERTYTPSAPMPERTTSAADLLATEFSKTPVAVETPAASAPTVQPRTERRKQARAEFSWKTAGTAAMLALLAAAVAIVLADSAGAIHFSFLGS